MCALAFLWRCICLLKSCTDMAALHRLSTAGLLAVLGMLNRQWYFCFLALLMLDIFSHWFQMYATLAAGAATHKVCPLTMA